MPDSYTHIHIAFYALLRAHQSVASLPCYFAGACGADSFAYFNVFRQKEQPDLSFLCTSLHQEKTGLFLAKLMQLSLTPQQQNYTMGFLTHYTTDCTLNPYISAMGDAGFFKNRAGRMAFEASIDSALFYRNHRMRAVPAYMSTPVLLNEDLAQVSKLLHDAILATYELDVSPVHLADAFHKNQQIRKWMYSPRGFRRLLLKLSLPLILGKKQAAEIVPRIQPGAVLPPLPDNWKNPYSMQEMHLGFDEVVSLTEETAAASISTAMRYWLTEMEEEHLVEVFGNNSYYTGQAL